MRLAVVVIVLVTMSASAAVAAPMRESRDAHASLQLPDWLSSETAARLAVGIDVLIPSYVPAPFGGEPEVQASDGFYSLYWLIPGAPPTFLRVTGTAGGEVPAFSYYDRNVQLVQNDTVQGYPAWHDVTPIYDLVYWKVGNVLYTVESHNLAGDSTMGVANALVSLVIPEPSPPETPGETSPGDGNTTGASVSAIGAPPSIASGGIAGIGVEGRGDVYLVASQGYFLATGDVGVVVSAGTVVDWQAPQTDVDTTVTFGAYNLGDDAFLADASTVVYGVQTEPASQIPTDLQCPATASSAMAARIVLSGAGGSTISASSGSWPAEYPNTDFQPTLDGGSVISGGLGDGGTVQLTWLAPDEVGAATLTVVNAEGVEVDSCVVEVVSQSGAGDLGAPPPAREGLASGDGTGISEGSRSVVLQVIANPIGFAGDASGGPEANGPDYGLPTPAPEIAVASSDGGRDTGRTPVSSSARSINESPDAKLGPAAGADGMYAVTLGTDGGTLASPFGATVNVPPKCLTDQTTVMIKPVDDTSIPATSGIEPIPGTAFDVAFSGPDGRAVTDLNTPALLTIALQSATTTQDARIYRVEGGTLKLMPLAASDSGSVSTEIDGIARYVVGVPRASTVASSTSINPFLIGGLGLIALLSAGLLISRGLARRKPRMIPARRPSTNRVRYR